MGISQTFGDFVPIWRFVQVDADPSARTCIGRREIALRRSGDEQILRRVRRLAPHGVPAAAVMIRRIGKHRERSLPGPERRLAVRQPFRRVWQSQAHLPDALDRTSCHRAAFASEPAADSAVAVSSAAVRESIPRLNYILRSRAFGPPSGCFPVAGWAPPVFFTSGSFARGGIIPGRTART